jgi:hypothetical protein
MIPAARDRQEEARMMGRQDRDQGHLFYEFNLENVIPTDHLLRRMNIFVAAALSDLQEQLRSFYSDICRPSVDPELMIRMLIVGYCYGIRHERCLCEEVTCTLAIGGSASYDLEDKVPHHSTSLMSAKSGAPVIMHAYTRATATPSGPLYGAFVVKRKVCHTVLFHFAQSSVGVRPIDRQESGEGPARGVRGQDNLR